MALEQRAHGATRWASGPKQCSGAREPGEKGETHQATSRRKRQPIDQGLQKCVQPCVPPGEALSSQSRHLAQAQEVACGKELPSGLGQNRALAPTLLPFLRPNLGKLRGRDGWPWRRRGWVSFYPRGKLSKVLLHCALPGLQTVVGMSSGQLISKGMEAGGGVRVSPIPVLQVSELRGEVRDQGGDVVNEAGSVRGSDSTEGARTPLQSAKLALQQRLTTRGLRAAHGVTGVEQRFRGPGSRLSRAQSVLSGS